MTGQGAAPVWSWARTLNSQRSTLPYRNACPGRHRLGLASRRDVMSESRREFLARTAVGVVGVAAAGRVAAEAQAASPPPQVTPVAGTPPAFGTAPPVGPEVSAATLAEAEKLVRVELTPADRAPDEPVARGAGGHTRD